MLQGWSEYNLLWLRDCKSVKVRVEMVMVQEFRHVDYKYCKLRNVQTELVGENWREWNKAGV